jgi:hypothetical protein
LRKNVAGQDCRSFDSRVEAIEGGLDPVTAVMLGIVIGALGVGFSILGRVARQI